MSITKGQWYKWSCFSTALLAAAVVGGPAYGQSAPSVRVGGVNVTGIPEDWSQRHVVFSNPGTEQDAIQAGRHAEWQRTVNSPRYVIQQLRKNSKVEGPASTDATYRGRWASEVALGIGSPRSKKFHLQSSMKRDWSEALGGPGLAPGQFPAKYSFSLTTADCTDYVAFPTGAAGSSTQATIMGFTNIYSSCPGFSGGLPTVAWALNTGGTSNLSPVIEIFGGKLAYIQTTSGVASLVLLKIANAGQFVNTGGSASAPTFGSGDGLVSSANFKNCVAPCYTTLPLSGSPNDTNSSPFYVYNTDTLYVGDDSGKLHQFTNVFFGTAAETTTNGWPATATAQTGAGAVLTSPVYDSASTLVFVGDAGGYLNSVTTTGTGSQTLATSAQLAANTGGLVDPPLVDSSNNAVYAFAGYGTAAPHNSMVYQFPSGTSISGSSGTSISLGNSGTNDTSTVMRAGAFDNRYYVSANSTGNLYSCVNGALFQIPISAAALKGSETIYSTAVTSVSSASACSPVTEFLGVIAQTTTTTAIPATQTTTTLSYPVNLTATVFTGLSLAKALTSTTSNNVCYTTTGYSPAVGDYILIDSEYMFVTATNSGCANNANTLRVNRAVDGSIAATHTNGATISVHADLITVPTGAPVAVGDFIQVDSETMQVNGEVTDVQGLTLTVARGYGGTTPATHASGAIVGVSQQVGVASATSIAANDYIQVDSEIMQVLGISGTTLTISRARGGTTIAAHNSGAVAQDVKDWLFMGVNANGNMAGCNGGCVFNYSVLGARTTGTPTAGLPAAGGTSGIITDNQVPTSTTPGASEIYYTLLGGTSAIQASQAGLQ